MCVRNPHSVAHKFLELGDKKFKCQNLYGSIKESLLAGVTLDVMYNETNACSIFIPFTLPG